MKLNCEQCGLEFEVRASHRVARARRPGGTPPVRRHCSRACMAKAYRTRMVGSTNPNFKGARRQTCTACGRSFEHYNKARKYCSWSCYQDSGKAAMNARLNGAKSAGSGCIDSNQGEIVKALRAMGVSVLITSAVGGGFPDLVCGFEGQNYLFEVKNPNTHYGRCGFSESQLKWIAEWEGRKPSVIYWPEDAAKVIGL